MMPVYEYLCDCGNKFEVFKHYFAKVEKCACGEVAKLVPSLTSPPEIRHAPKWHWGVGAKVSSGKDVDRVAKEKGLHYVGRDGGA